MNRALPLGQQKVLKFLEQRYTARMPMPTLREIAKELGFESTRGAADHLTALERKGFIIRERGKASFDSAGSSAPNDCDRDLSDSFIRLNTGG